MCSVARSAQWAEIKAMFRLRRGPEVDVALQVGPYGEGVIIRAVDGEAVATQAQWGFIPPASRAPLPADRRVRNTHARVETVHERVTYRGAWAAGQRCLIPLLSYTEPNWETGRHIPWEMRRADGTPWALAGIWGVWTEPGTGRHVYHYAMLTQACDDHPLLSRLHRPDPSRPLHMQDKRAPIHIPSDDWDTWLMGSGSDARQLVRLPDAAEFDQADVIGTDAMLNRLL